jgi:uncharacterized protein (DUF1015 family)
MSKIKAFKALRPVRDKVHLVATRPYYSYKKNVLLAKLEDNPYTFLHIINPEFGSEEKTKLNSVERFNLISQQYKAFIEEGILFKEKEETIYIYRQTKYGHEYTGIVAGANIQEYKDDLIKKHEATLTSREAMFTSYLDIVGYNAEPVLLSYPNEPKIETILKEATKTRPEYEFTTTDKDKHELWVLSKDQTKEVIEAFEQVEALYIADGHHRSASSVALSDKKKWGNELAFPNQDFFLAFFIDEQKLNIMEFNRLVKRLGNISEVELLNKIKQNFELTELNKASKPEHEHQFTMCLKGTWYKMNCHPNIIDHSHPVKSLDPEILTNYVLTPILGIQDLKTDENIDFVSGAEPLEKIENKIEEGKIDLAFILFPVSMQQVKEVADNNMIMPPKSTWVEPKLRSGLTIYTINE